MLKVVEGGLIVAGDMGNPPPRHLHEKLAVLLKVLGLSQAEAGRRIGYRSQYVSKILRTGRVPEGADVVYRLAMLTGATVEELMNDRISSGELLDIVQARATARRLPTKEVPREVAELPADFLAAFASALKEGGTTGLTLSNYPETGETYAVVVKEGEVIYQGPERRKQTLGGRRGGGSA